MQRKKKLEQIIRIMFIWTTKKQGQIGLCLYLAYFGARKQKNSKKLLFSWKRTRNLYF